MIASNKLALSPYEDKRFYIDENTSVGYGHPLSLNQNNGKNIFSYLLLILLYTYINQTLNIFFSIFSCYCHIKFFLSISQKRIPFPVIVEEMFRSLSPM